MVHRVTTAAALAAALTLGALGCASSNSDSVSAAPDAIEEPASGIDVEGFDASVRPQDDFYRYINGGWLDRTEIPADRSNYGAFTKLADDAEIALHDVLEELAATASADGEQRKLAEAYRAFMDEAACNAAGLTPIAEDRAAIAAATDHAQIAALMGRLFAVGVATPLVMWVNQDAKDATRYAVYFHQGGLGLPDRDYYTSDDERIVQTREAYQVFIADLVRLGGASESDATTQAATIYALEEKLASHHWGRAETRDRERAYNVYDRKGLTELAPEMPWAELLDGLGLAELDSVIVRQPTYVTAMAKIFVETPVEVWKSYLDYFLLNTAAPYLSQELVDLDFDFYGKTVQGISENRPRWKRGVSYVETILGEALGKLYVERHFDAESKAHMERLVGNLTRAFAEGLDTLEWMTPQTRARAHEKLAKLTTKIGYPNEWRDYSALEVRPGEVLANMWRGLRFEHDRNIRKLGSPVDRNEWFMTPQTVNAYYNSSMNEIVFPAAILQPPFFQPDADDAVNYGGIGAIIGHEVGHGFDDQGRKSDGHGNLVDWWTEADAKEFEARAKKLVTQYDAFTPFADHGGGASGGSANDGGGDGAAKDAGLRVQGQLTLGENIGDLGGLTIAYRAYQLSLGGRPPPMIDGMTGPQRFFAGWAQIWRRKYREAELRRRLLTDTHAPSRYRVIGVVANMPEFYEAFQVTEGDRIYLPPAERVKIW